MTDPTIDRARLVGSAYKDSAPLQARIAIYAYEQDRFDHREWVLGSVDWPAGVRAVDVGCGPGRYLSRMRELQPDATIVGCDLSAGMARESSAVAPAAVADAQQLPFATGSFDRVLAAHMLYHVPDVLGALREFARVCAPGARVILTTNGERHIPEIFDLVRAALLGDVGEGQPLPSGRSFQRFSWESAPALLEEVFEIEQARDESRDIVVPVAAPVVDYVNSMRSLYDAWVAPGESWETVMGRVQRHVDATIERDGAWRTRTHPCYFVCRA